ncbi:hypothetical protein CSUI_004869, partial [Cystoisospora suis]
GRLKNQRTVSEPSRRRLAEAPVVARRSTRQRDVTSSPHCRHAQHCNEHVRNRAGPRRDAEVTLAAGGVSCLPPRVVSPPPGSRVPLSKRECCRDGSITEWLQRERAGARVSTTTPESSGQKDREGKGGQERTTVQRLQVDQEETEHPTERVLECRTTDFTRGLLRKQQDYRNSEADTPRGRLTDKAGNNKEKGLRVPDWRTPTFMCRCSGSSTDNKRAAERRNENSCILELGISPGGSSQMWFCSDLFLYDFL